MEACPVAELGVAGRSDPEVHAAALTEGYVLLTENVADFARIAAEHVSTGGHHPGVLIALSSRFSRRPGGIHLIAAAVDAVAHQHLEDRVVYLELPLR